MGTGGLIDAPGAHACSSAHASCMHERGAGRVAAARRAHRARTSRRDPPLRGGPAMRCKTCRAIACFVIPLYAQAVFALDNGLGALPCVLTLCPCTCIQPAMQLPVSST